MRIKSNDNILGSYLSRARLLSRCSLREVEKATGISNAYLSQLESGNSENPSPHKLRTLAEFYKVQYLDLMIAAGYLKLEEIK